MGDVLPSKSQTGFDRLKRRIEVYRSHQNACLPRYEISASLLYDGQKQETSLLKKRFIESKTKKQKKSYKENSSDGSKAQLNKPLKRSADDAATSNATSETTTVAEDSEKASKIPRIEPVQDNGEVPDLLPASGHQSILPKFPSLQSMSQFSQSPLPQSSVQQKPQIPQSKSKPPEPPVQEDIRQQTTSAPVGVLKVECKQEEQDPGDSDLCQFKSAVTEPTSSNSTASQSLSDNFPNHLQYGALASDIDQDLFDQLLYEVLGDSTDATVFNFSENLTDANKDSMDLPSPNQLKPFEAADSLAFINTPANNQLGSPTSLFRNIPAATSEPANADLTSSPATTSTTFFNTTPAQRLPSYSAGGALPSGLGLEFKLTEPSPAAQTLKQMAEQHQNMQQKQQQQQNTLVNPSLTNRTPQAYNQNTFNSNMNSLQAANFLTAPNQTIKNNSLPAGTNIFNSFDQQSNLSCINSFPGSGNAPNFPANCGPLNPTMFSPDMQSRNPSIVNDNRMDVMQRQKPPAYGTTHPLAHFGDNSSVRHQNLANSQQQRPVSRQFQAKSALSMNPVQTAPPSRQHNPQSQQQHCVPHHQQQQQQHPVMQRQLNPYGNFPSHQTMGNTPFQQSLSQPVTFSPQFNANATINRPPPEYKATLNRNTSIQNSGHLLVDQLNAKYSKQQRPPNVTITPDGSAIGSQFNWRNQQQFAQGNFNNVNASASIPPVYNQYRMTTNQVLPNPIERPTRASLRALVMGVGHYKPRTAMASRPRNTAMVSMEQHRPMALNNSAMIANNVMPPELEIQRESSQLTFDDGLDNIDTSDFLNFDQVITGEPFPILDDIDILDK
ncbi:uncharacterized protein CDAR_225392 [Caerostris darwini]|uniref:Neurogenic mastermind-like N-terminal domain-containing protein n=1 Tax=Caerostris darwini TaxID=1538125 RepID=A0AAV4QY11_9ARAC|nr:uncharacterized protein CDAR_225392 [Caerostris darwini]